MSQRAAFFVFLPWFAGCCLGSLPARLGAPLCAGKAQARPASAQSAAKPPAPLPVTAQQPGPSAPAGTTAAIAVGPASQPPAVGRHATPEEAQEFTAMVETAYEPVEFTYASAELGLRALLLLAEQARMIRETEVVSVLVVAHADERGSAEYNIGLSTRRAVAVATELVAKGVPTDTILLYPVGKAHPLCHEKTEACHRRNRRAQVIGLVDTAPKGTHAP